jgi:HEAT repeat protein
VSVKIILKNAKNMSSKQKTVESLIIVLKSGNGANRCFAAQALGNIGDSQAVKPLLSALHDEDEDVVMDAVAALGQIGTTANVADLMDCYRMHPVGDVKVAAVEALGSIAEKETFDHEPLLNFLMEVVSGHGEDTHWEIDDEEWDDWWDAQFKAIEALAKIGDPRAASAIVAALDVDEAQELNEVVFAALAKMGESGEKILIERLLSSDRKQRRYAAKHLAKVQTDKVRNALSKALEDSDVQVCVAAAKSLAVHAEPVAQSLLLRVFQDSRSVVREQVLEVISHSDFSVPEKHLLNLLKDEDQLVRLQALRTVAIQQNVELAGKVYEALRDPSLDVVAAAVEALGALAYAKAGSTVAALLSEQGLNTELRIKSAIALGTIGSEAELPTLLEMLKDPEQAVRLNSLNSIAHLEFPGTQDVLLAALRGELLQETETQPVVSLESKTQNPESSTTDETITAEIPEPKSTLASILAPSSETELQDSANETAELTAEEQHFLDIADANLKLNQQLQDRKILAPHQDIKRFAAAVLGEERGQKIVPGLVEVLEDPEPLLQLTAAESLGRIGDTAAVKGLVVLLGSAEKEVRLKAASALGKMKAPESVSAMREHFPEEKNLFVRIQILQSLKDLAQMISSEDQRLSLEKIALLLLEDPESGIRMAAAELLLAVPEKNEEPSVIPMIAKLAFAGGGDQRLEIGRMLRKVNPESGSAVFLNILSDPKQESHHRVAIEALQEIHRI